jgi:threonine aldolase
MRQAGVIAAAGIVALDSMVERLAEDHGRANAIGKGKDILSTAITKILT